MSAASEAAVPTGICPQCGALFRCAMEGGDQACWCASLPPLLPLPAQSDPGSPATCLCPVCLKERLFSAGGP